jgi:hypothetical protein
MRRGLALLTFVSCACVEPAIEDSGILVRRDSAGIAILEIADLSGLDTTSWRVDPDGAVTIGASDGDDPYLFSSIGGVARLGDGRIVVADRGTDEIRFFDSSGAFLETIGGRGDGPAEYRSIHLLQRIGGDSLVVVDREGGRVSVLDPAGTIVRRYLMARHGSDESPTPAWAIFEDGSQLQMLTAGTEAIAPGVMLHHAVFRRVRDGGEPLADYEGARQSSRFVQASVASPDARRGGEPPSEWSAGARHFLFAPDPRVREWRVYSLEGLVERIVRVGGADDRTSDGDKPLFTSDPAGNLWVQLSAEDDARALWLVVSADGQVARGVWLPHVAASGPASRDPVMEIGDEYVLAASVNLDLAPVVLFLPLRTSPE